MFKNAQNFILPSLPTIIMKNQLIYFISIFLLFIGCQVNTTSYDLTIKLSGNEEITKMFLIKEIGADIDSIESVNGVFKFNELLEEPQLCAVYSDKYPNERKLFILDYGKIKIYGDPSKLSGSIISFETPINNELRNQFQKQLLEYENKNLAPIMPDLRKAQRANDLIKINTLMIILDSLALDQRVKIYDFVESNSNHQGMAEVIFEELIPRIYLKPKEFLKVYNLYSESIKSSFYGEKLKDYLDGLNTNPLKIGEQVTEFTMNNVEDDIISIKDYYGKYVLIDFWASWCAPCRAKNPNLKRAYDKYKTKGFEIVGISMDTDKEAWKRAIEKDELNWINLSDLKGWESELAQRYKIKSVPSNMLLDKTGRVIAVEIRGNELHNKLEQIFEK